MENGKRVALRDCISEVTNVPEWVIEYWIKYVFGLIALGFGLLYKAIMKERKERKAEAAAKAKEDEAIKLGVQALLRDRIIQAHNYCMREGFCPIHDRDNINNLYNRYHDLGGNGTVTHLVECVNRLPTDEDAGAW